MAKPLIPVEAIYEYALELLDAEGADALTTGGSLPTSRSRRARCISRSDPGSS